MSGFRFDAKSLEKGLDALQSKSELAIRAFCETGAQKMESEAKMNARWTDRTGAARQRLNAGVERRATSYMIRLAHGVDYGVFLELAHEKRFAIIPDTIRYVGTFEILPSFERLLERL